MLLLKILGNVNTYNDIMYDIMYNGIKMILHNFGMKRMNIIQTTLSQGT